MKTRAGRCVWTPPSEWEDPGLPRKVTFPGVDSHPCPRPRFRCFLSSSQAIFKCQCLLFTQVHLHILVFKTWQSPQIKRTFPSEHADFPFPTLRKNDPCPDSASRSPAEQSKIVTTGITCGLLTGCSTPCFRLPPNKTTSFYESMCSKACCKIPTAVNTVGRCVTPKWS